MPTHHLGVLHEVQRRRAEGETVDTTRLRCAAPRVCMYVGGTADGVCRTGIASGSPVPIEMMKRLIEQLNLRELTVAFGMSTSSSLLRASELLLNLSRVE